MTRDDLCNVVSPCLGSNPWIDARESLAKFRSGLVDHIFLNYDWIKDWSWMRGFMESGVAAVNDGQSGLSIYPIHS
jgi:hypothetical protein